jgi:hypothetical protein
MVVISSVPSMPLQCQILVTQPLLQGLKVDTILQTCGRKGSPELVKIIFGTVRGFVDRKCAAPTALGECWGIDAPALAGLG